MKLEFRIGEDEFIMLTAVRTVANQDESGVFQLIDKDRTVWMELELKNSEFFITSKKSEIQDTPEEIDNKLDRLILEIIEAEQSGLENNETSFDEDLQPFNPEDIKVHAKQFSLRLISDMIDNGDIDLSPDFQRNLVWNNFQKSRLIESILLRIPLPMFYFSEDEEGRITIVDGLQRLTTIKEFMENEFALKNLEYLGETCEGRFFEGAGRKLGLDPKYVRWFNQTQFSVNVIDPSSPPKVKYDIFRRINTGGKPLNNQEIRNCLAGSGLRETLRAMAELEEFKTATDYSIKSTRMEDHEVALRFMLFYSLLKEEGQIESYNGYMDSSLDDITERLYKATAEDLKYFVTAYSNAMRNAKYLFGQRFAFRKVRSYDLLPGAYKQLINKALFVSFSVLLADFDPDVIEASIDEKSLLVPLADEISEDYQFLNYLSYGTNGRNNLIYAFEKSKALIINTLAL